ncbi:MAG: M23 family metallopeptidase [Candidatus Cloacimonadales bacterium]
MAIKKRWHIAFSATGAAKSKSISLSQKSGMLIIASISALLLLAILAAVYIGYNQVRIAEADQILEENAKLKEHIFTLSNQIDSILIKLQQMEEWEDKIRKDKNFKQVNKEIREMGIGGRPVYDSTFINLGQDFSNHYNSLLHNLTILDAKLDFDYESWQELSEQIALQELLYRNTPSIYPTFGRISEHYGWRTHPITKQRTFHRGLDLSNLRGTAIYATADGVVSKATRTKLMGKYIQISHEFGYKTKYGHLDKILVKVGEKVRRGQIIGEMGNTGRSTGAHVHYEVLRYNKTRNPAKYLNKLQQDIVVSR